MAVASPAGRAYAAGMEPVRAVSVDDVARARPEYWSQETIAEANGSLFKAAKGVGSTAWHAHDDQDEVFLVTHGTLIVELRTGDVAAHAGELLVVPRGVEHRPPGRRRGAIPHRRHERDLQCRRRQAVLERGGAARPTRPEGGGRPNRPRRQACGDQAAGEPPFFALDRLLGFAPAPSDAAVRRNRWAYQRSSPKSSPLPGISRQPQSRKIFDS